MTNLHRGEVSLTLGGRALPMRLTLQALAEIEAVFGGDLTAAGDRLANGRPRAADLVTLLGAAIRGGGSGLSDREIAAALDAGAMADAVNKLGELFTLTFGERAAPSP